MCRCSSTLGSAATKAAMSGCSIVALVASELAGCQLTACELTGPGQAALGPAVAASVTGQPADRSG